MSSPPDYRPLDWEAIKTSFARIGERIVAFFDWMDKHGPEIRDFLEKAPRHKDGQWGYVLELLDGMTGVSLALALEARARYGEAFDEAIGEGLADWLLEPQLLDEVRSAIERANLPAPSKRHLQVGLDHLQSRDYELAVPLLINALEGSFWRLANERGLIVKDPHGHWVLADRPSKQIRGVEGLFPLEGLEIDDSLKRFLRGLAYGGSGNPYRHGTAEDAFQIRALCLFVALLAWLELAGLMQAKPAVRAARMRAWDSREQERAQQALPTP